MDKIIAYKNLKELLKKIEPRTKVLVGGCFDILHPGHLAFLKASKKQGDILIVALEANKNVKRLKGGCRPVNTQAIRAEILSAISFIDYIVLLPEMKTDKDYQDLILKIKPKIIAVTKNDPRIYKKRKQAMLVGAKVVEVIPYLKKYSTTKIINTNISKLVSRRLEISKLKTNLAAWAVLLSVRFLGRARK